MTKSVDLTEIQQKLYDSLKLSGWANLLKSFLLSSDFTDILTQLYNETTEKRNFTPMLKDIFNAFIACPYKDLHTIIVTKEPFVTIGCANGIPFDCSKTEKEQYATTQLFDAITRTVYFDKYKRDLSLTRWANQGVLLLNSSLTVQIDKPDSHTQIWKPFIAFLLDTLNIYNRGLHFVFMGDDVKDLAKVINVKAHYKFMVSHPTVTTERRWDSQNIFPILTRSIYKNYKYKMIW